MIRGSRTLLALSSYALVWGAPVLVADVPANPYQSIIERNVFNLKPALPNNPLPPTPPPPKITLTGLTTILGDKRVLFKIQIPAKPPLPAKEESYILTEGQRDGELEVLEIDDREGIVKINNHGTIQTLDLATDGAKPANVPTAAAAGPAKPFSPVLAQNPGAGPPARAIPPRTLRIPQMPAPPANPPIPGQPARPPF